MRYKNKIIKVSIIMLLAALLMKAPVFATAGFSTSASNVQVGDSFVVTVSLNNVAAWNIHVKAAGPVTGCSIAQADASTDAKNTSKTFTTTCVATNTGTISVDLSGDTTTENGSNETVTGHVDVSVTEKWSTPSPISDDSSNKNSGSASSSNSSNSNRQNSTTKKQSNQTDDQEEETSRSSNTDLSIAIEGYDLTEEDGLYKTKVPYDVAELDIKVTPKDEKTTINGDGKKKLNVGKNNILITATAEDGTVKVYQLEILRGEDLGDNIESSINENQQGDISYIPIIIILAIIAFGSLIASIVLIKKLRDKQKKDEDNNNLNPIQNNNPDETKHYDSGDYWEQ